MVESLPATSPENMLGFLESYPYIYIVEAELSIHE